MSDRSYHEGRAREELVRAAEAADPAIARAHRELAALHRRRSIVLADEAKLALQVAASSPLGQIAQAC